MFFLELGLSIAGPLQKFQTRPRFVAVVLEELSVIGEKCQPLVTPLRKYCAAHKGLEAS